MIHDQDPAAAAAVSGTPLFDGPNLRPEDHPALNKQLEDVRALVLNEPHRTLEEIQQELAARGIHMTTNSISARLRDFRKEKFGAWQRADAAAWPAGRAGYWMSKRVRSADSRLWEYHLGWYRADEVPPGAGQTE